MLGALLGIGLLGGILGGARRRQQRQAAQPITLPGGRRPQQYPEQPTPRTPRTGTNVPRSEIGAAPAAGGPRVPDRERLTQYPGYKYPVTTAPTPAPQPPPRVDIPEADPLGDLLNQAVQDTIAQTGQQPPSMVPTPRPPMYPEGLPQYPGYPVTPTPAPAPAPTPAPAPAPVEAAPVVAPTPAPVAAPTTGAQLELMSEIIRSQQQGQTDQLNTQINQLAQQNADLANQVAEMLNMPTPVIEAAPMQPGAPTEAGAAFGSVTPAGPGTAEEQWMGALAQNLLGMGVTPEGIVPGMGGAAAPAAFGAMPDFGAVPGFEAAPAVGGVPTAPTGAPTGGVAAKAREPAYGQAPAGPGLPSQPAYAPPGSAEPPVSPRGATDQQQQLVEAAARAGMTDVGGKPIPGFRPITDAVGNTITAAPSPAEGTPEAQAQLQNIFDEYPILTEFMDPVLFTINSPFLGEFDMRQSDIGDAQMISVPALDAQGNAIPGSTTQIFANPTTQKQRDFNLAAQPEDTQRAYFEAQVQQSDLGSFLQAQNIPEQQPNETDRLIDEFINAQLTQMLTAPADAPAPPPMIESMGPPEFPGGPPTRIVEPAPLTQEDVGAGVDIGPSNIQPWGGAAGGGGADLEQLLTMLQLQSMSTGAGTPFGVYE